jgi:membrane protein DedA with SNARE-associated domain
MTDTWLAHWGYLAVAVGTFIEGEATLLAAGALAQRKALLWPWVVACGCLGSVTWSQIWFRMGRTLGSALIERRPRWRTRAERAQRGMTRHAAWYLLMCRFIVGMGTASPAVFGAAGFSPRRFLVLDALGAIAWSAAISGAGWGASAGWHSFTNHVGTL